MLLTPRQFSYGYVAAALTLVIINFLNIIPRTHTWKPWHVIRIIINFLLAISVSLIALLYYNSDRVLDYLSSPWVLPTVTLV